MAETESEGAAPLKPLPRLVDRAGLMEELGVSRAVAEAIFRLLPRVRVPGVRREWVQCDHVERAIERWTFIEPPGGGAITRANPQPRRDWR